MILGGDQPFTRRVIGLSTCLQVGSMFNEGIWNAQKKTWEGSAIPRSMEGEEAHYKAFLLGMPSLQAAGCSTQRILKLPCALVILCFLQLTMAMGRFWGEFVDREDRLVNPTLREDLQVLPSERRAGWSVYGLASPDGEETANFFEAWPDISRCLGIRPSTAKYKAIANMWDLLQAPHVPPVPSIEHWKRDQYCPVTGGNFRKSVPTCMRYASVRRLEVFENPWKDARKFWQPDWPPKTQPISVGMFHGLPSRPCRGSSEEILAGLSEINPAI